MLPPNGENIDDGSSPDGGVVETLSWFFFFGIG
jgi:hypothetical protein